jgi:ATP-binding cassette subfamily C (CFTR/MRP) protein 1
MTSQSARDCFEVDDTFGPWAGPDCRSGFDFTLLFEESVLTILPLALLIFIAPFRILYLSKRQDRLRRSKLLFTKLVRDICAIRPMHQAHNYQQLVWTILLMFDIAHLTLWVRHDGPKNRATIPSAALSFVGSVILLALSSIEHMRNIRPSWLLNVYLLLTVVFDIARSRSYSLSPDLDAVSTVFTSRVAVKLLLAIIEARPKRRLLLPQFADSPPEAISGPYKRALFWWLNALFKKGYSESLAVDDLFHLDKHLQSDYLHHLLGSSWHRCKLSYSLKHMLCTLVDSTTTSSNTHRPSFALCSYPAEAQMAGLGGGASQNLFDRLQLLPAILD